MVVGGIHYVGVDEVTLSTVKITVSSDPQTVILSVGDVEKFDLDGDDYYDLKVTLNSIENNKADITLKSIYEEVTVETIAEEAGKESGAVEEEAEKSKVWIWVAVIIVLLIIIGGGYGFKKYKKENRFKKTRFY